MHSKSLTINNSLEVIQSFKTILLKKFCMRTKVLMFQYTCHEYTIRNIYRQSVMTPLSRNLSKPTKVEK